MNRRNLSKTRALFIAAVAVIMGTTLVSRSAFANSNAGQVTFIEYQAFATNQQLVLQQNTSGSTFYFAQQTSPGCSIPNLSIDTIKLFSSLAQAGYLAGKNVTIQYTPCVGVNWIIAVAVSN